MKKFLIFLLIAIGVGFILVQSINLNKYKHRIEKAVYNATGYKIKIKNDISVSLYPLGIKVSNIAVANPTSFYKKNIAHIGKIYIGVNPFSIFGGGVEIRSIEIDNLKINIVKNKNGRINIASVRKQENKHTGGSSKKSFSIKKLVIKNAALSYIDQSGNLNVLIKNINISSSLKYSAEKGLYKGIYLKGKADIKELGINKLNAVENISLVFDAENGILSIEPIKYMLFKSKANMSIKINLSNNMPTQIKLLDKKLNLLPLSKALYKNIKMSGFLFVSSNIFFNASNYKKSLRGTFLCEGKNIILYGEDLDRILKNAGNITSVDIGSFFIAGPLSILSDKAYYAAKSAQGLIGGKTVITHLFVKVNIKNGIGDLYDAAFSTKENRIAAKGKLNFITNKYDNVRVALLNKIGCAKIIQKIGGSFSNPHIEAASIVKSGIIGKISSFFNKLEKSLGIKKKRCSVFYNGVVKQP